MADDIDDLLEEVEANFLNDLNFDKRETGPRSHALLNSAPNKHDTNSNARNAIKKAKQHKKDELSDAIDEICNIPPPLEANNFEASSVLNKMLKKKCPAVYVGGSQYPLGLATPTYERCCDNVLCFGCDFKVIYFDNFKWKEDTNYLFLRNNMPDFQRLKKQLTPSRGVRAYACQCEWKNYSKDRKTVDLNLKWICSGH